MFKADSVLVTAGLEGIAGARLGLERDAPGAPGQVTSHLPEERRKKTVYVVV